VAGLRDKQRLLLIIPAGGVPKGVILLTEADRQLLTIDALAMAAAARNLGFGAEAVYVLEQRYPGARLVVGIPLTNGLAVYFWLRIGYRPLFPRTTQSGLAPDRLWMAPAEAAARDFRPGR